VNRQGPSSWTGAPLKIVFLPKTFLPKANGTRHASSPKTVEHLVAAGEDVLVFLP